MMNTIKCLPNCALPPIQLEQQSESTFNLPKSAVLAGIKSAKQTATRRKCTMPVRNHFNNKGFVKRPRNSFIVFVDEFSAVYGRFFPSRQVLSKVAAGYWKGMRKREKKDFMDQSSLDRQQYQKLKEITGPDKEGPGKKTDSVLSGARCHLLVPKAGNSSVGTDPADDSLPQVSHELLIVKRPEEIMGLLDLV